MKKHAYQNFTSNEKVILKKFDNNSLHMLITLQEAIINELEYPEYYRYTSLDVYKEILEKGAQVCGLFIDSELIAFGALLFPNTYDENLLRNNLFNKINRDKTYYYKAVAVSESYRGNSLQLYFNNLFEKKVKKLGGEAIVLNVHPNNKHSINNFKQSGYTHIDNIVLNGVYERHIYIKKLY